MHIFIDESGIFRPSPEVNAWSSIGGVAVPSSSLSSVNSALVALKKAHGLAPDDEFKRVRPDCTSNAFAQFIAELGKLGCTLHVVSTRGGIHEEVGLRKHRDDTRKGILNYGKRIPEAVPYAEKIIGLMDGLKDQQYNQCLLQVELVFEILNKALTYYSRVSPRELASFTWVIDRKEKIEIQYETVYKEILSGLVSAYSLSRGIALMISTHNNYSYLLSKYAGLESTDEVIALAKDRYDRDISTIAQYIQTLDLGLLLRENFSFEDSEVTLGLQVADLLVSSVNRCLKQNYDNNEKMAAALGGLMINSRYIDSRSLTVVGHGQTSTVEGEAGRLIDIMDAKSKKIFSELYRMNFSRNFPRA